VASRHVLSGAAAAFWASALAVAAIERNRSPDPTTERPLTAGPLVSIVLPARNEARGIGPAVRSHLAQTYRQIEVIVVDDQSTDETSVRAASAADGDARFRGVSGTPVPAGWIGKSWACWQGAQAATGEWLLFTDADVVHAPETLARCLALAIRMDRGGLTLTPRVDTVTVAERLVMPAAATLIANVLAPGFLVRSRRSKVVMAAGAYLLVRRDLYDSFGGHEGIAGRMVDDVALAMAVKRTGGLLVPAEGTGLIHLRMYHDAREMWRGWRKNAAFAHTVEPTKGLVPALTLATLGVAPLWALVAGCRRHDCRRTGLGVVGFVAQCALQRLAAPVVRTPARYAPTLPIGTTFMAAAALRGSIDRLTGRGPTWRGRRYPDAR
jgi:chlorobactene glucosyltransferase